MFFEQMSILRESKHAEAATWQFHFLLWQATPGFNITIINDHITTYIVILIIGDDHQQSDHFLNGAAPLMALHTRLQHRDHDHQSDQ